MGNTLDCLQRDAPDIIVRFLNTYHDALKTAFRSMDDINRNVVQDRTLGDLGDEFHRLSALDLAVHPAYLRLTEAVLGLAILPAAQHERRHRGKDELTISLSQRLQEVGSGPLAPFMEPFQRNIRNAIAHGSLVFREFSVEYRDQRETIEHQIASAFHLFDRAVDVCNGFLLAYRLFFIASAEFLTSQDVTPPLPVVIRELQAQAESPTWHMLGALETQYDNDRPALRLLIQSSFESDLDVYKAAGATAAAAERLAPGFDTYEIRFDAFGMPKGVGSVKGMVLRDLRTRGISDPMKIAGSFDSMLIYPRMTEQREEFAPEGFIAGRPFIRRTRLVRKADWIQLDAKIVLEIDNAAVATKFVRSHVRDLISFATAEARAVAVDDDLRSLPIGAAYLDVFKRDARQRDLIGLGSNLLCRIIERPIGPIADWPLHKSIVEGDGRLRIEWNTAPFGEDG